MSPQLLVWLARSAFILLHLNAWSVRSLSVELETSTVSDDGRCIGGDVGLTHISVLLQYKILQFATAIAFPDSEWVFLAEISPNETFNSSVQVVPQIDQGYGVQFRLLQPEHGGGRCNCWRLERLEVVLSNGTRIRLSFALPHVCLRVSDHNIDANICGNFASDARGVITRVLTYSGVISNDCPGDSGTTLISSKGPPLPASCDQVVPRM